MPNTFAITSPIVAKESTIILSNQLGVAGAVFRDYAQEFTSGKAKGDNIDIRVPFVPTVNEFTSTISVQTITETKVNLQLEKHYDISLELGPKDRTLQLDDFNRQITMPAMIALAEKIDSYVFQLFEEQLANFCGNPAAVPSTLAHVAAINGRLGDQKVPSAGRLGFVSPTTEANLLSIENLVRVDASGTTAALREANVGKVMGTSFFMGQGVRYHTAGTQAALTPAQLSAAVAAGATSLPIDGGGANATIKKGDVLTVAGVKIYGRTDTTVLSHHVVTADVTLNGSGVGTLVVSPALPMAALDNSVVTIQVSHAVNPIFHPYCLALAIVPLEISPSMANAGIASADGAGVRVVMGYDMSTKKETISFDLLCGGKVIDGRLGARFMSPA